MYYKCHSPYIITRDVNYGFVLYILGDAENFTRSSIGELGLLTAEDFLTFVFCRSGELWSYLESDHFRTSLKIVSCTAIACKVFHKVISYTLSVILPLKENLKLI